MAAPMESTNLSVLTRARAKIGRVATRAKDRISGIPERVLQDRRGLPIPPGSLIHKVANTESVPWFLSTGQAAADCLVAALKKNGLEFKSLGSVLDFGCGIGRVMRHWAEMSGPRFHGTDYNPALITWCRDNLDFAEYRTNTLSGRLDYRGDTFDLVYALSVFTHLDAALQMFWMDELYRVLKPGGMAFITVHGRHYLSHLTDIERQDFEAGKSVVRLAKREGSNDCASFHPESAVRTSLAARFEVMDFLPEGALGNPRQDAYLLRKAS
jgi:SAM-dependent methyltransferase